MKTSSGSKNSHKCTHEYVYNQEIKKDVLYIKIFIQEVNEESPLKYEPNNEQNKHGDFKLLKEVSPIHP